jgi:hypothetical protein
LSHRSELILIENFFLLAVEVLCIVTVKALEGIANLLIDGKLMKVVGLSLSQNDYESLIMNDA